MVVDNFAGSIVRQAMHTSELPLDSHQLSHLQKQTQDEVLEDLNGKTKDGFRHHLRLLQMQNGGPEILVVPPGISSRAPGIASR